MNNLADYFNVEAFRRKWDSVEIEEETAFDCLEKEVLRLSSEAWQKYPENTLEAANNRWEILCSNKAADEFVDLLNAQEQALLQDCQDAMALFNMCGDIDGFKDAQDECVAIFSRAVKKWEN